jgi:hypothetical protein
MADFPPIQKKMLFPAHSLIQKPCAGKMQWGPAGHFIVKRKKAKFQSLFARPFLLLSPNYYSPILAKPYCPSYSQRHL